MTSDTRMILALGIAGVAGYLLVVRRNPVTGQTVLDSITSAKAADLANQQPTKGPGNTAATGQATDPSRATAAIGLIGAGSAAVGSIAALGGAGAAAGAAGASAATGGTATAIGTGIGTAGVIGITAGIGAGVLLTWAVWKKGLFRGGEEALLVNPDRDQFLLQFGPRWQGAGKGGPTWEESGNGQLAALLTRVTGEPNGSHYWTALSQADTVDEFVAATRAIKSVLLQAGISIQAP